MSKVLFDKRYALMAGDTVRVWHHKRDGTRSNELSYTHAGEMADLRIRIDIEKLRP